MDLKYHSTSCLVLNINVNALWNVLLWTCFHWMVDHPMFSLMVLLVTS